MMNTIKDVSQEVEDIGSLSLDAKTLGEAQWQFFTQLFPSGFTLTKCTPVKLPGFDESVNSGSVKIKALAVSGHFENLFATQKAGEALVYLFDFNRDLDSSSEPERHVIVNFPAFDSYADFATPCLASLIDGIQFSSKRKRMIFSTLDYASNEAVLDFLKSALKADFPVENVRKGLNFYVDRIELAQDDGDLDGFVRERLTGFELSEEHDSCRCLIHATDRAGSEDEWIEPRPLFTFMRPITNATFAVPGLSVRLDALGIEVPLARRTTWDSERILVEGTVKVSSTPLSVIAALNYDYSELSLTFTGFPTLSDFTRQLGLDLGALPVPLSQMLDIKLSSLMVALNLSDKSVSAIGFELKHKQPIDLIKGVISLEPELAIQIYDPLDSELRAIEGVLTAQWELGGIKFTTGVSYPSLAFGASMNPGQTVSTRALVQRLLPVVNLPELVFTTMEIEGNVQDRSFTATIEATIKSASQKESTWGFEDSRLKEIRVGFAYFDQQMTHCGVGCLLQLGSVEIDISAQYDAGQDGLQFEGHTTTNIDISMLISELGTLFHFVPEPKLPEVLNEFKITNLAVSFNTHSKDFSCTCEGKAKIGCKDIHGKVLDGQDVDGKVSLDIKHEQSVDQQSVSVMHLSGQITVGKLQFALVFDKSADESRALATYHNLQGETQSIQVLAESVLPGFPKHALPANLSFAVHDALLGYSSQAGWLFGVDIEGGLDLSNVKLPDFPLLSQFAPPPGQTLKLAVQVVGASKPFTVDDVGKLNALNPGGLKLPNKEINGLALAATLRLGQEVKQLSLPIGVKTQSGAVSSDQKGTNPLSDQSDPSAVAAPTSSTAQAVSDDGMQWMMIQKTYASVHFERVGIAYKNNRIKGELDAALSVGGLTIALDGLSVTSPLTKFDPEFSLRGLGIDYRNGPLEIGGAFLKQTRTEGTATYTSFAGLAVLRTKALTLSAIGSYALKDGHPSLFIYAVLDYPLGGPAFFFVTGLAAGFGYNRALTIPGIEQVESFPLVRQAMGAPETSTPKALPVDQKEQQNLLTERLEALEGYIPRAVGEHFLAIGVSFTSFKTVKSFALLTLKFGREFEIDLLGLSTLNVPNVAFAQLALKATFKPEAGFLGVRAQLTPNSYLLSQRCHLTGGFAFLCWFQGDKDLKIAEGDFVLTLGGYHPLYNPPAHYPRLPRLGFDWQVDDYLHLKGDAYYAMVPHALMAGCHLEATWQKDQLKAWFTAGADFLICWQPYHYDAKLYVDLGASYTFDFFGSHTVTVDLGADLHLWGPEFAGEAHIHWWIISFTVNFGKTTPQGIKSIQWEDFKTAFLPARSQVCGITLQQGLIRQIQQDGKDYWIVNPKDFVLVTNSVIPSTASKTDSQEDARTFTAAVRPMGAEAIKSTHTITILYPGSKDDDKKRFKFTSVKKSVPAAMWGTPEFTDDDKKFLKPPNVNEKASLIENTLAGFEIRPLDATLGKATPFEPTPYDTEPMPDAWKWEPWMLSESDFNCRGTAAWNAAANNTDGTESGTRNRLLQALGFANYAN